MIEHAALSDIGGKRQTNQDRHLVNPTSQLYLVADGMGGHAGGEVASQITVDTINDFVALTFESDEMTWPFGYNVQVPHEHNALRTAVMLANLMVCKASEEMTQYSGMGSTVVGVWMRSDKAFCFHVGDSRLYLLRGNQLQQLTEDHSLVQEQIKGGIITAQQAENHTWRHVVTRAIGSRERYPIEVQEQRLEAKDQLLLCTDGLSDMLKPEKIREILVSERDLHSAGRKLIEAANEAGGEDNITVLLLQYTP